MIHLQKDTKDAKIIFGYECNNNCIFCIDKTNRHLPEKSTTEIKQEIIEAKKRGFNSINFLGGEITIRNDCLDLLRFSSQLNFESINMTTNGRMFYYYDFAKKILSTGVSNIIFSVHGHNPALHDYLTGTNGSFNQLSKGVMNLKKLGFTNIGTNTTIVKHNFTYLPNIAELLAGWKIERAEFIYCYSNNKMRQLVPKVTDASRYIIQAIEIGKKNNFNWILQNTPIPCLFHGYFFNLGIAGEEETSNLIKNNKSLLYSSMDKRKRIIRIKLKQCFKCTYKNRCPGVWKDYLNFFGKKEVIPVHKYNEFFNLFWDYATFLIKINKISQREETINKISYNLFNKIDTEILEKNQKFDFSLSSKRHTFRFSFNDFGERETSYEKYLCFFSKFENILDLSLIQKILEYMEPDKHHQTTIGAEIGNDPSEDRIKLYFEDFDYQNHEIFCRLNNILKLLNIPHEKIIFYVKSMKINSIGIDFFKQKKIELKIYTRHESLEQFFKDDKIFKFQKHFPKADDEFYLIAFRFDNNGNLISKKAYKVFNIIKYIMRNEANNKMIMNYLEKCKQKETIKLLDNSISFLRQKNQKFIPVLFAQDFGLNKWDIYFTIR